MIITRTPNAKIISITKGVFVWYTLLINTERRQIHTFKVFPAISRRKEFVLNPKLNRKMPFTKIPFKYCS